MDFEKYSRGEVVARGEEIYETRLRRTVETPENIGKMIVIEIESGDYEIDKSGMLANDRILERHPDGIFYGVRVGFLAAETIGGVLPRRVA